MDTQWRQTTRIQHWLHQIFSGRCRFCAARCQHREICPGCLEDLPWITAACRHCGMPLASGADCCARCLSQPPAIDRTVALWAYCDGIDALIRAFKLNADLAAGRLLAELAREALARRGIRCIGPLLPMPLHPKRYRERGFNQSAMIAHWLGPTVMTGQVQRIVNTPSQRGLDAAARQTNLQSAFVLNQPPPRAITLIDDVLTTGASLHALAQTLRRGGTQWVEAIVLARAI